jgi:4-hydroxyacetophenone monooxygenase
MASYAQSALSAQDDETARRALDMANLNALRIALYQATGDEDLARMAVIREPFWAGAYEVVTLAPEHHDALRSKALAFLRSGQPSRLERPDPGQLRALMDLFVGAAVNDFIFDLGREEVNFDDFPRGVEWSRPVPDEVKAGFHVGIVGAGVSGLVTAIQLDRLGIPWTIIERNPDVGGTWWTNDYPDARVDIPSHHYQLSVTKKYPWKHWFATQPELLEYIRHIADTYDLRRNIRFSTDLSHAQWNGESHSWRLELAGRDGSREMMEVNALVSAAGLFNAPNMPDIPGIDSFEGKIFHTTNWDHSFDYSGKRVGIIGVGSTGAQLMPRVAKDASHVSVFQRSPNWVAKMEGYRAEVPADLQWLFQHFPHYWNWYVFATFHTLFADNGSLQAVDEEWRASGGQINRKNDMLRENICAMIEDEFSDDHDFIKKITPTWPPFAKRLVVDNGWFDALKQPHVSLVTDGIDQITPSGILTRDGVKHALDLIVIAGGFKAERYLWPVKYVGRNGVRLEDAWGKDGARAHLGITLPDFPNMFIIYGPNMQARAGGLFSWLEIWARYSVQGIVALLESGASAIECRRESFDAFNTQLDAAQHKCIWGIDSLKSYYVNEHGRQVVNSPFLPSEVYSSVQTFRMEDFFLD